MAVFGLFATYATCASRPDVGAPLASTQALFAQYWLLFETFDFLRLRHSTARWTIDSLILPINAFAFFGLSARQVAALGSRTSLCVPGCGRRGLPGRRYAARAACVRRPASTKAPERWRESAVEATKDPSRCRRHWPRPPSCFAPQANGSTSGCSSKARFCFWRDYFRAKLFAAIGGRRVCRIGDQECAGGPTRGRLHRVRRTHVDRLVAHGGVVGGSFLHQPHAARDRGRRSTAQWRRQLIAMLLVYETPHQYLSVAWLAFAAILFEAGFRWRQGEFRYQSYVDWCARDRRRPPGELVEHCCLRRRADWPYPWLPLAICAALLYAATLRIALNDDRAGWGMRSRKSRGSPPPPPLRFCS